MSAMLVDVGSKSPSSMEPEMYLIPWSVTVRAIDA
jgi:hypothetical protein